MSALVDLIYPHTSIPQFSILSWFICQNTPRGVYFRRGVYFFKAPPGGWSILGWVSILGGSTLELTVIVARYQVTQAALQNIYLTLIWPVMEYSCAVWSNITLNTSNKLQAARPGWIYIFRVIQSSCLLDKWNDSQHEIVVFPWKPMSTVTLAGVRGGPYSKL